MLRRRPVLIVVTMLLVALTGNVCAVPWWDGDYDNRRQLTISTDDSGVASNYTVRTTIDTDVLVDYGQLRSDRKDWRIVYWNGSSNIELDRDYLCPGETWFRLQTNIAANSSDTNHYVYYGYSAESSAPSTNKRNIYLLWDDFTDGDYTSSPAWNEVGLGTKTVTNGEFRIVTAQNYWKDGIQTPGDYTNFVLELYMKDTGDGAYPAVNFRGNTNNTDTYTYQFHTTRTYFEYTLNGARQSGAFGYRSKARSVDQFYHLRVKALDSNMWIWSDGSPFFEETDGKFPSGKITLTGAAAHSQFDDVKVRAYVSPEPRAGAVYYVDNSPASDGTVASSTSTSLVATAGIFSGYNAGDWVEIISGTGSNQYRQIMTVYTDTAASDAVTVTNPWSVNPGAGAGIVVVDVDSPGVGDPFHYISAAVSAASDGDKILIAGGTYAEGPSFVKGLALDGGYNSSFTAQTNETIISNALGNGISVAATNVPAVIENLTVVNCGGHGIYAYADPYRDLSITIRNCNVGACTGNGIYVYDNYIGVSSLSELTCTIENCLVRKNGDRGIRVRGGSYSYGITALIKNCTVSDNACQGIYWYPGRAVPCTLTVKNTIISGNGKSGDYYGIQVEGAGDGSYSTHTTTSTYNDLYDNGNTGEKHYYTASATWPCSAGPGDFSVEPLFVNTNANNYHLKSKGGSYNDGTWTAYDTSSQCMDAGDPSDDYGNELAPNGDRINLGAYGNTDEASKQTSPTISLTRVKGYQDRVKIAFDGYNTPDTNAVKFVTNYCQYARRPYTNWIDIGWDTSDAVITHTGPTYSDPVTFTSVGTSLVAVIDCSGWALDLYKIRLTVTNGAAGSPSSISQPFGIGIHVVTNSSGGTAYQTIQDAVDAASDGDTLLVAQGVYNEGVRSESVQSSDGITVDRDLTIKGGYDAAFATQTGRSILRNTAGSGNGVTAYTNAVMERFSILECANYGVYAPLCYVQDVTVRNCIIGDSGNNGIYARDVAYANGDRADAIFTVENCLVYGSGGRGIYILMDAYHNGCVAVITNCTVVDSVYQGIFFRPGRGVPCTLTIRDSIIVDNGTGGNYYGIQVDGSGDGAWSTHTIISTYNDLYNNGDTGAKHYYTASALYPCEAGPGDINVDPLFVDTNTADYHLKSKGGSYHDGAWTADGDTSPCLDMGDPSDSYANEPAPNGARINLGAYGDTEEASKLANPTLVLTRVKGQQQRVKVQVKGYNNPSTNTVTFVTNYCEYAQQPYTNWVNIAWDTSGAVFTHTGPTYSDEVTFTPAGADMVAVIDCSSWASDLHKVRLQVNNGTDDSLQVLSDPFGIGIHAITNEAGGVLYQTIQDAVNAAATGDVLRVASGMYNEGVENQGAYSVDGLVIDRELTIKGGYNATFSSQSGESIITSTEGDGITCYSNAILEKLSILDCEGHGIHGDAATAQKVFWVKVSRCTIGGCAGKGIYGNGGVNTPGPYGGLQPLRVENCLIRGNVSHGIHAYHDPQGGEMNVAITNCTIADNGGRGIYYYPGRGGSYRQLSVKNSVIAFNGTNASVYGIEVEGNGDGAWSAHTITSFYNNVYGNGNTGTNSYYTASALYPCVAGDGDISADPLFADRDVDDYHLKSKGRTRRNVGYWQHYNQHSPCIDGGDPDDSFSGEPQPNGRWLNLGAYGNTWEASTTEIGGTLLMFR